MIDKLIEKYKIAVEEYTEEREKAKTKSSRARIKERKTVWWVIAIRSDEKINTYKEIIKDLEELKPTTINGYSIEEIITILNALDLERILDIKMTMKNLQILSKKLQEDFQKTLDKSMKNMMNDLEMITMNKEALDSLEMKV